MVSISNIRRRNDLSMPTPSIVSICDDYLIDYLGLELLAIGINKEKDIASDSMTKTFIRVMVEEPKQMHTFDQYLTGRGSEYFVCLSAEERAEKQKLSIKVLEAINVLFANADNKQVFANVFSALADVVTNQSLSYKALVKAAAAMENAHKNGGLFTWKDVLLTCIGSSDDQSRMNLEKHKLPPRT